MSHFINTAYHFNLFIFFFVFSHVYSTQIGLKRHVSSFSKFQKVASLRSFNRIATKQVGHQRFDDYGDVFYTASISLGTQPQYFDLVLDTGSSIVWVANKDLCTSTYCTQAGDVKRHLFDSKNSSTYASQNRIISIRYGTGSMNGTLSTDVLEFPGAGFTKKLTQQFLLAFQLDKFFGQVPIDGILGLSWSTYTGIVPPIAYLNETLDKSLFTVYMKKIDSDTLSSDGGYITYGSIDTENCEATVDYVKLSTTQAYWQFDLDGVSCSDYSNSEKQQAISDTGTSFLLCPEDQITKIGLQLGAYRDESGTKLLVECNRAKNLPDIVFKIGGKDYYVPASQYVLQDAVYNSDGSKSDYCLLTLQVAPFGGPDWILGDTFIRSYCNIYDIGNKRIGFAKAKGSTNQAYGLRMTVFMLFLSVFMTIFVYFGI